MSYIVLARKWRPKSFEEVVGQEHITTTLLNSIRSGRTAHAYLFVGPRGIGKTTTARIFSKALNCPDTNDGEPCGECDACREIAQGRSIDVLEIDGASNNSVEDIRALRENVKIAPAYLRFKVYIIDEVHMLSPAAFNAFLKTLEEPPEHIKFILATTEAQKIPGTVLSRCQRFDFRRLTSRQISRRLKEIVDTEGVRIDERALFAIARATEGSMRDALSILDQLVSFSEAEITLSDVHAMLGTVGLEVYHQIATAICDGDSRFILKKIDEVIERGKDIAQFLKELTVYFRNLFLAGISGGEELVDLPEEDIPALKELSARFQQNDLVRIVQDLSELESRFRQVPSARVAVEMLLMRMSQVGAEISIDNLLSKLTAMEKRLRGSASDPQLPLDAGWKGGAKESEPEGTRPSSDDYAPVHEEPPDEIQEQPEPISPSTEQEDESQLTLWREFLKEIREHSMSIYSFLDRGRFCGVENGQVIVAFDSENSYNKTHLEKKEIRMLLDETLKAITATPLKVNLILERADTHMRPLPGEALPQKELILAEEAREQRVENALSNPIVKRTLELFKGKIVYVSG